MLWRFGYWRNPYEASGAQHNQWVVVLCNKARDLPLSPGTLMFADSDFTGTQLSYLAFDTTHIGYNVDSFSMNSDN
jgi:hypothetical protein